MNRIQVKCPDLSEKNRISVIGEEMNRWIHTDEFRRLVALFSAEDLLPLKGDLSDLHVLKKFVEVWDYRKKQKEALIVGNEGARWLIKGDAFVEEHADEIYRTAEALGMFGNCHAELKADYILPLGGTITSNLLRCRQAKQNADENGTPAEIIALTTMRILSDTEKKGNENTLYGEDCIYEYESMCKAIELVFGVEVYEEDRKDCENPNDTYAIRRYIDLYNGCTVTVVAAPSTDPAVRRANSADCFRYLFEHFAIPEGSRLVNATGDIYCPYQQVKALVYAIEHNVIFETCGYSSKLEAVKYLQEMKSTIDAMYDFACRYNLI